MEGYGWNEEGLEWIKRVFAPSSRNSSNLTRGYTAEFISFLFSYKKDDKLVYREGFLKWYHKDLKGELTTENQLEVFETAFSIKDEADWKALADDFEKWIVRAD
ncbi:MAG: hypothetical protein ACYTDT_07595 [Planctomycetota bacterium]